MTDARNVSAMHSQQTSNGDGHIHAPNQREDLYKLAYEAGLASGREEGYRKGYQEGYADCIKFGYPTPGTTEARNAPPRGSRETASHNESRLRGLPCAKCGCPSYSGEVQCPRCGAKKAGADRKQLAVVEEE